jgi:hypothetical protein
MVNDVSVLTDDPNINNDSLVDSPTNYGTDTGAGGEVRGNYATLNPLDKGPNVTLSNGNLDLASSNSNSYDLARSTVGIGSGKWYWETTITDRPSVFYARFCIGISAAGDPLDNYVGKSANSYGYFADVNNVALASKVNNDSFTALGEGGYTTGDIVMVAFDNSNGNLWFGKNGTWLLSGNPSTGANPIFSSIPNRTYFPGISPFTSNSFAAAATVNFGQRPFAYTAPSGFKALCTTNLAEPTIADGSTAMNVALYTGNGSTQTISGLNFSPDLVWIKKRSGTEWHCINDTVRGAELYLSSNTTNAESGASNVLTAFTSTGYTVGSQGLVNDNGFTFASWCWDAGSSTVTNTEGSITSQVRANPSAGFSVVTYTGNSATDQTIGHGLGVVPGMVIVKSRGSTDPWVVYHTSLGATKFLYLNQTTGESIVAGYWGTPSSTTFGIKGGGWANNSNGVAMIAYCFAPVAGYSSFGSYTGNGSADGPFVYTGFRPRWVMTKASSSTGLWNLHDTTRSNSNPTSKLLWADSSSNEVDYAGGDFTIDCLSNGFKARAATASLNSSGVTYIYYAVAENPFQYARAR